MKLASPLLSGIFQSRYKRFFVDIRLDNGENIIAHCVNSGSMRDLLIPESPVRVMPLPKDKKRTLDYRWEMIYHENTWVGVNTRVPNVLMEESLKNHLIPELKLFPFYKREVKYGKNSRIDFLLSDKDQNLCYLEIKNVHLKRGMQAQFPDCVTERGAKHLEELSNICEQGHRALMIYVIQRNDCEDFSVAQDLDPIYAAKSREARQRGVEFLAYDCLVTAEEIKLHQRLEISL